MRVILLFCLIFNLTFANSFPVEGFEALFLKIASESFFSEFERDKNMTVSNKDKLKEVDEKLKILYKTTRELKEDIKEVRELKAKLTSFLSEVSMSPLGTIEKKQNEQIKSNIEVEELKMEILMLKNQLENFSTTPKKDVNNSNYTIESSEVKKLTANSKTINVRAKPSRKSKIMRVLKRGEIIQIESCNKYGWCKIQGKDEFIEKYLFLGKNSD